MLQKATQSRDAIRQAAADVLGETGPTGFTIDRVAARAGCAKGLVHYHFRTKTALLTAVVDLAATQRVARLDELLGGDDAIGDSWQFILAERDAGLMPLSGALATTAPEIDEALHRADEALAQTMGRAAARMLARDRMVLRVSRDHVGHLLVALLHGAVVQLAAGGDEVALEEAYAIGWLGVLSLGVRRQRR